MVEPWRAFVVNDVVNSDDQEDRRGEIHKLSSCDKVKLQRDPLDYNTGALLYQLRNQANW